MPSKTQLTEQPRAAKASRKKNAGDPTGVRLTRDDWLDAAFEAALDGGFGAVRVLTLADKLGVSRGSFYWHFVDHAELVAALIDRWYQRELRVNASAQAIVLNDPSQRILEVLDGAMAHSIQERNFDRFELALRSLASKDSAVATLLEDVDRARLQMVYSHYIHLVGDEDRARELSALFYLAVVGAHQALNRPATSTKVSEYLKSIIATHLVHGMKPRT